MSGLEVKAAELGTPAPSSRCGSGGAPEIPRAILQTEESGEMRGEPQE